jgi:hypothetical protein
MLVLTELCSGSGRVASERWHADLDDLACRASGLPNQHSQKLVAAVDVVSTILKCRFPSLLSAKEGEEPSGGANGRANGGTNRQKRRVG